MALTNANRIKQLEKDMVQARLDIELLKKQNEGNQNKAFMMKPMRGNGWAGYDAEFILGTKSKGKGETYGPFYIQYATGTPTTNDLPHNRKDLSDED